MKKLVRSKSNKVAAGILGGVGEYLEIDPVVVRLLFVAVMLVTGVFPLVIGYVVALFIVPKPAQS